MAQGITVWLIPFALAMQVEANEVDYPEDSPPKTPLTSPKTTPKAPLLTTPSRKRFRGTVLKYVQSIGNSECSGPFTIYLAA